MRPHFGKASKIATSSVKAEFTDLKHRTFKNQLPMRIDKFILQHLEHLDGKIKLASNEGDLPSIDKRNLKSTAIINEDNAESVNKSFLTRCLKSVLQRACWTFRAIKNRSMK